MRKWRCTICNYIHTGDAPPEECPVCRAGPDKFVEVDDEESSTSGAKSRDEGKTAKAPDQPREHNALVRQILEHHLHPMSVHIPNGVIPVSVAFVVLAAISDIQGLAQAAFYNLIFVVLSMPVVWISGLIEWRKKYSGALTKRFKIKIASAAVATIAAVALTVWHIVDPDVAAAGSDYRWPILVINFVMLGATATAGFVGGKLVFRD